MGRKAGKANPVGRLGLSGYIHVIPHEMCQERARTEEEGTVVGAMCCEVVMLMSELQKLDKLTASRYERKLHRLREELRAEIDTLEAEQE